MHQFILGIDQGTTGTSVCLMNVAGQIVHAVERDHEQFYPHPGWVEQDPLELWQNAYQLINQLLKDALVKSSAIVGVGIANQGESVMLWDRHTRLPLHNAVIWQDIRTQADIDKLLTDNELTNEISQRTGLLPDSYFSASKIRWLIDHTSNFEKLLSEERICCGTLDTWLIWNLTEGNSFVTDVSTASRTLLLNIHSFEWDPLLLEIFNIPPQILPPVQDSTCHFGTVSHRNVKLSGVPILASLVDQPAAMVGQGCLTPGKIKATYGTGCFVNLNTGDEAVLSENGLLTLLAWRRNGIPTYGLDGGILTAGATVNWLNEKANLIQSVDEIDLLCSTVSDSGGVIWLPAQVGLGAPYWDRSLRGAWLNLDLASNRANMVLAILEGIALRVAQVVEAMKRDIHLPIETLRVDGGLCNSRTMMQTQADLLGLTVEVLADKEATIRGVCSLAARQAGLWGTDKIITEQVNIAKTYEPQLPEALRNQKLISFNMAIDKLKEWHKNDR